MAGEPIIIIGAGLAGLSAAIVAAENGREATLVSAMPSERAQSAMAEGGINAALDTMGEGDSAAEHFADTMAAGAGLADPNAARALAEAAPGIVRRLAALGTVFNVQSGGELDLRNFGGQRKKRTAFAQSGTGKQIMTALIAEARKYEARGLIRRHSQHGLARLLTEGGACAGCAVRDTRTGETVNLRGAVIVAAGGMHGLFGSTTGSKDNTAEAAAALFRMGIPIANCEFIQYHPTTAAIPGKRLLISEAARAEGGRLFALRGGKPWHFMEEMHPELGNLAPRDVISREMALLGGPAWLDMRRVPEAAMRERLRDTVDDCLALLRLDPRESPIPVSPGIHYFMGGIQVDEGHCAALPGLYAAGECCCQYHGANRLGGNSMLGAIYGGMAASRSAMARAAGALDPIAPAGDEPAPELEPTLTPMPEQRQGQGQAPEP
ncbi:MAG: FAD-binding protein, partial [Clostridiales bacterium]|nr:FAD-binding protein [Clostridiales bacterium]